MATARDTFLRRHAAIKTASEEELVQTKVLGDDEWNDRAGVLRNGLMVVAFNTLEDYFRTRTQELLAHVPSGAMSFGSLPEGLRRATTEAAIRGLQYQLKIRKGRGDDGMPFVQQATAVIASTTNQPFMLSELGLGWASSNVSADDVAHILSTFDIADTWAQMTELANRCGFGALPLRALYQTALQRRHLAAHDPSAVVALGDLAGFLQQALATALSFDLLITLSAMRLVSVAAASASGNAVIRAVDVSLRFLDQRGSTGWAEVGEGGGRAYRVHADRARGIREAGKRAQSLGAALIIRNTAKTPIDWRTAI